MKIRYFDHSATTAVDERVLQAMIPYFAENFGSECVSFIDGNKYSLSLADANLFLLKKIGIPDGNVFVSKECTCCFKENGAFKYGSFRRQTSSLPQDLPLEEKQKHFTVQTAFVFYSF